MPPAAEVPPLPPGAAVVAVVACGAWVVPVAAFARCYRSPRRPAPRSTTRPISQRTSVPYSPPLSPGLSQDSGMLASSAERIKAGDGVSSHASGVGMGGLLAQSGAGDARLRNVDNAVNGMRLRDRLEMTEIHHHQPAHVAYLKRSSRRPNLRDSAAGWGRAGGRCRRTGLGPGRGIVGLGRRIPGGENPVDSLALWAKIPLARSGASGSEVAHTGCVPFLAALSS